MNILFRVAVVCAAACLCVAEGAPDGRLARVRQQRPTRGFKNVEMMTARGFGKRDGSRAEHTYVLAYVPSGLKHSSEDIDSVYGLENFWDMLESPERDTQDVIDDKPLESIPLEWFVKEVLNNPEFARSVVRKFIDINQDGMLSSEELLRNVA